MSARKPPPALDWGDAAAVQAWLLDVSTQAHDGFAAGEDATRPPGLRELGRPAARRIITEASRKLADAFALAGVVLSDAASDKEGGGP